MSGPSHLPGLLIEIEENPNCSESGSWRFKPLGSRRVALQTRTYDRTDDGEWCWVTGWTDRDEAPHCPAWVQPVEESGQGKSYLVYGGAWGIRLKPVEVDEAWSLESPNQWGAPHLLLADLADIKVEADIKGTE